VDAKAINSLDTLITQNGRSFVRHQLLDFGSSLGSAGVAPADYWEGSEYLVEPRDIVKQMMLFGFSFPKWHTMRFHEAPSMGRLPESNANFNPDLWKPRVPNQAFLHARPDDKFWAAQKLMTLTSDLLRAAIRAGDFAKAPGRYRAVWFRFDNATAHSEPIGETFARTTQLEAPNALPRHAGAFVKVELSSVDGTMPSWEKPVNVFFRYQHGQWHL